jgi:hypothetical protein
VTGESVILNSHLVILSEAKNLLGIPDRPFVKAQGDGEAVILNSHLVILSEAKNLFGIHIDTLHYAQGDVWVAWGK